jgi:RimJ/RimL family protein N-acetyltransferase
MNKAMTADRNQELCGARLILRPFTTSDITDRYLRWLVDDEVNRYSRRLGKPADNADDVRRWLASLGKEEQIFAIHAPQLGHIGNIKYGPVNRSNLAADISILIGDVRSWGQGFGAEAIYLISKHLFANHGVNRLSAASINPAFIRMVEKLGWRREGIQREESLVGGRFYDSVLLSLLKREFRVMPVYESAAK